MKNEKYTRGLDIRREVMSPAYVDKALAEADDFSMPMQDLVTEYCWGEIWGNTDLPRKTRSIINLALLSALNRPHELKGHIRGALRNGCTKAEIRAVFMQVAVYCGVPVGIDSFRAAKEVFKEAGV